MRFFAMLRKQINVAVLWSASCLRFPIERCYGVSAGDACKCMNKRSLYFFVVSTLFHMMESLVFVFSSIFYASYYDLVANSLEIHFYFSFTRQMRQLAEFHAMAARINCRKKSFEK